MKVFDVETNEPLAGIPSTELVKQSHSDKYGSGAVHAYEENGTWHWVDSSQVATIEQCVHKLDVKLVYVA